MRLRRELEHAAEAHLTRVQSNLVGPWVWFPRHFPHHEHPAMRAPVLREVALLLPVLRRVEQKHVGCGRKGEDWALCLGRSTAILETTR